MLIVLGFEITLDILVCALSNFYYITYFFAQSENLNYYLMKTANIPVCGNILVYENIVLLICLKIDYTLRCIEYICSVSSPLRSNGLLIMKTLTCVL